MTNKLLEDALNSVGQKSLSVSIPIYNEEANLEKMVLECVNVLGDNSDILELILINDFSTDETDTIATRLEENYEVVKYIRNEKNIGCHPSQIIGWQQASKNLLTMLPSDNQIPPENLITMVKEMKDCDLLWTKRVERQDNNFRILVSIFYNMFAKKLFRLQGNDVDSTVMIKKTLFSKISDSIDSKSAFVQVQIGYLTELNKGIQKEIGITHRTREQGKARGINIRDLKWVPRELIKLYLKSRDIKNEKNN